MSITVTITGLDGAEFVKHFNDMAATFGYTHPAWLVTPVPAAGEVKTSEPAAADPFPATDQVGPSAEPEKRKPGRPRKEAPPEKPAAEQTDMFETAPEQTVFSLDECKEAGQLVIAACGTQKLRDLVTEFGVQRISELHKDKYGAFVKRCRELTGAPK